MDKYKYHTSFAWLIESNEYENIVKKWEITGDLEAQLESAL